MFGRKFGFTGPFMMGKIPPAIGKNFFRMRFKYQLRYQPKV